MKKVNVILLFAVFLVAGNVGYSGTVASPYEVGTWQGFRTAAITYTFDDDLPDQLVYAVPYMDSNGFAGTLFTVTSSSWYMPPNWTGLQNAASNGFEIASHTVDHSDLSGMSSSAQITEYSQSQATINSYIPGNQCLTIAYPNCDEGTQSLISQYYIAGRVCSGQIMPATPSNFYQLSCFILGSAGINTLSGIEAEDNAAASSGGWCVFLIHAMDSENGYSPISHTLFQQSIQYLAANRSTFWVNTFLNVVKYIKERNDVSISESSNTGDSITLAVTDTLSNTIYNYPITIRRPLPAGWGSANVSQNAQAVPSSIVKVNSTAYVMFDVVPDGGAVVLSRGIYGDFTGNGVVDLNDLSGFLKFWLVNDCNGIVGLDVDEDCVVNFDEFAVLAENWRQVP
ncbi:MAG: polysaccharide deacetylase family protein [Sedimentisphaerales bacterium]|jgi:oligosaccharide reducing-end xylanase